MHSREQTCRYHLCVEELIDGLEVVHYIKTGQSNPNRVQIMSNESLRVLAMQAQHSCYTIRVGVL